AAHDRAADRARRAAAGDGRARETADRRASDRALFRRRHVGAGAQRQRECRGDDRSLCAVFHGKPPCVVDVLRTYSPACPARPRAFSRPTEGIGVRVDRACCEAPPTVALPRIVRPEDNARLPTRERSMRRSFVLAFAAALAALPLLTFAQAWPSKPVRIIVPSAAGGPADLYARAIAEKLQASLAQLFVVEDKPGGGSIVGTDLVAKSPADGYTLLMMSNTHTVN